MVLRLSTSDKDFGPAFAALLAMKREVSEAAVFLGIDD
jgi:hypothetical protein